MNHTQLQKFLKFAHKNRVPVMLWGPTGIGKTTAIYEYGQMCDAKVITLHLASQEPGDLVGLPGRENLTPEEQKAAIEKGLKDRTGRTIWLRPQWMPDENDPGKYIFFLDEFNRGPKYVLACMFPFLLEGRLHTHRLPKDSWVIAAGNPADDNYDVTEIHDKALISRLCHIKLTPTAQEWLDRHEGIIDSSVHSVIAKEPGHLQFDSCDLGFKIEPDARAITSVGIALKGMSNEEFEDFGYEYIEGCVGPTLASMIVQERRKQLQSISPDEILKQYLPRANSKVKMTKARQKVLAMAKGANIRSDVIGGANRKLVAYLGKREKKLSKYEVACLTQYLKDIPADASQALLEQLANNFSQIMRELSKDDELYEKMRKANEYE